MPAAAIQAVSYHPGLDGVWDDLVARARNGHFMATRRFLAYHGNRFHDRSLLFMRNGRALAAIALHEEGSEWVSHRGLAHGGLIAAPELSTAQTTEIFYQIALSMRAVGITGLRYTPLPLIYQEHPFEDDLLNYIDTRILDLLSVKFLSFQWDAQVQANGKLLRCGEYITVV